MLGAFQLREGRAEPFSGADEAHIDGIGRNSKNLRDLLAGQAVVVAEGEGGAGGLIKGGQGVFDEGAGFTATYIVNGVGGPAVGFEGNGVFQGLGATASADAVDSKVSHDAAQPGAKMSGVAEVGEALPSLNESVLADVIGGGSIGKDLEGDGKAHSLVSAD